MKALYTMAIRIYSGLLSLAAIFNHKASLLNQGRRLAWKQLEQFSASGPVVWVHCASLGEFEQGRPVIEALKEKHPEKNVVLTFFSPSGYEIRKNYEKADLVLYLPADTPRNARRFIALMKPEAAIFVKYEFWAHFFKALHRQNIPLFSVSAIFRKDQIFFKWYGSWFRKTLQAVTKFYVQDEASGELLNGLRLTNYSVVGDTRFDRVAEIVNSAPPVPVAEKFTAPAGKVLVAGSTWPEDEDILVNYINNSPDDVRLIIAPHEVHESHILQLIQKIKVPYFRFSKKENLDVADFKVMIVDTIGLLSAIYRYGQIAYIGGGFGKGIHNTLEAATYGMPVVFGPRFQKFKEAHDLINVGGGFSIKSFREFSEIMDKFWNDATFLDSSGRASGEYVTSMCGATRVVLTEVFGS